MVDDCGIESEGVCCCACRYHLRDFGHPNTNGSRMSEPRGYVCAPPEFEGAVYSGWPEHGLCEQFAAHTSDELANFARMASRDFHNLIRSEDGRDEVGVEIHRRSSRESTRRLFAAAQRVRYP